MGGRREERKCSHGLEVVARKRTPERTQRGAAGMLRSDPAVERLQTEAKISDSHAIDEDALYRMHG